MALARVKMVAIQDFCWEKSGGKRKMQMCPLGMLDWVSFFTTPAGAGFNRPISLRVHYEPAPMIAAIGRDLAFLCKQVDAA